MHTDQVNYIEKIEEEEEENIGLYSSIDAQILAAKDLNCCEKILVGIIKGFCNYNVKKRVVIYYKKKTEKKNLIEKICLTLNKDIKTIKKEINNLVKKEYIFSFYDQQKHIKYIFSERDAYLTFLEENNQGGDPQRIRGVIRSGSGGRSAADHPLPTIYNINNISLKKDNAKNLMLTKKRRVERDFKTFKEEIIKKFAGSGKPFLYVKGIEGNYYIDYIKINSAGFLVDPYEASIEVEQAKAFWNYAYTHPDKIGIVDVNKANLENTSLLLKNKYGATTLHSNNRTLKYKELRAFKSYFLIVYVDLESKEEVLSKYNTLEEINKKIINA